jgi:hypothetical protein
MENIEQKIIRNKSLFEKTFVNADSTATHTEIDGTKFSNSFSDGWGNGRSISKLKINRGANKHR